MDASQLRYDMDSFFHHDTDLQVKLIILRDPVAKLQVLHTRFQNLDILIDTHQESIPFDQKISNAEIMDYMMEKIVRFKTSFIWEKFCEEHAHDLPFRPILITGNKLENPFQMFINAPEFDNGQNAIDWAQENIKEDHIRVLICNARGIVLIDEPVVEEE